MFKKLFGKKNDGFYMQAEEAKTPAPVTPVVPVATVAPVAIAANVAEPVVVAADASPAKKTSVKDKKKAKPEKDGKKVAETPAPVAVVAVAAAAPAFTNFATDYLIKPASSSNRRRPGANMKQFMDMARQVETKKSPGQRVKGN
jgi:hypothetical protein